MNLILSTYFDWKLTWIILARARCIVIVCMDGSKIWSRFSPRRKQRGTSLISNDVIIQQLVFDSRTPNRMLITIKIVDWLEFDCFLLFKFINEVVLFYLDIYILAGFIGTNQFIWDVLTFSQLQILRCSELQITYCMRITCSFIDEISEFFALNDFILHTLDLLKHFFGLLKLFLQLPLFFSFAVDCVCPVNFGVKHYEVLRCYCFLGPNFFFARVASPSAAVFAN